MAKRKAAAIMEAPRPPRRRVVTEVVEGEDEADDLTQEFPDLAAMEAEAKLGIFHTKFAEKDYKVRVECFNSEDNEFEMVDTVKLDGFDSFSSLKKYGGGRYRLSLLDEGGLYVKGGRMEVRIAKIAGAIAAAEAKPVQNDQTAVMLEMMKAQNAQNIELLKAMIGRPAPVESKAPTLTELIAAMAGLKNLSPKEGGEMGGVRGTLELMKLVKDIMPAPAEPGGEGIIGELSQAMDLFAKVQPALTARRAPARPAPAPASTAIPLPPSGSNLAAGTVVVENPPTPEPEDPMKPVLDKAYSYVPQLVSWAGRGKDIEEAADFVLDEIENEIVPMIVKHYRPGGLTLSEEMVFSNLMTKAQDPAQVAAIFTVVPALAPHKEWFERVIAEVVAMVAEGPDAPAPEKVENGEGANA